MPYFDVASETHRNYLLPDAQCDANLTVIASNAEADVIEHFTRGTGSGADVQLDGYKADPDDASAEFKTAMARAIATVVNFRSLGRATGAKAGAKRERLDEYEIEYERGGSAAALSGDTGFPRGWDRHLQRFMEQRKWYN